MEILATVKKVLDKVEGTSSKGTYCIQPLLVAFEENATRVDGSCTTKMHTMVVNLSGECARNAKLEAGQVIRFQPYFDCREYGGRYYQKVNTRYVTTV